MGKAPRRSDRRSEFWLHPAVQALLAAEPDLECPREAVRRKAAGIRAKAVVQGWRGPPFDMNILASLLGMRVEPADWLTGEQDGCLVIGNPTTIYVGQTLRSHRRRFTIAHEIVHTLLPGVDLKPGKRYWMSYQFEAQSPVEQLCQVGASELLMPSSDVEEVLAGEAGYLDAAGRMGSRFEVSLEAATRNLVDLSNGGSAMVVLKKMHKPAERRDPIQHCLPGLESPLPEKRLRVFYSWTSRPWEDRFFPQYKSVPESSVAYTALDSQSYHEVFSGTEDWSEVGGVATCRVQASMMRSAPGSEKVLCVVSDLRE